MRLISNVERDAFCLKTLSICPVSCMCIMEIVYYIKMTVGGLEQHSVWHDYNTHHRSDLQSQFYMRVGTLIVVTIYLQLIQNRYMFRSFTVLQCSHQHCVNPLPAMWKS